MNRLSTIALALVLFVPPGGPMRPLSADAAREDPATAAETSADREAAAPNDPSAVPHRKFLLDYLIVVLLIGGAVYSVCRPSRRV